MKLTTPNLTLPTATWTKELLITGAAPGATIFVRAVGPNPRDVVKFSPVAGGSDWIPLLPGTSLQEGDILQVKQVRGPEDSEWTTVDSSYPVKTSPTKLEKLMAVTLNTFPWECGEYVLVTGAEAGATVEVFQSSVKIGSAPAPHGWARILLTNKLSAPGSIEFRQMTPIGPGPPTVLEIVPLPFPRTTPFPAPQFLEVPHGCEDIVKLKDVYGGSLITMNLSTGENYSVYGEVAAPVLRLPAPLKWNKSNPPTATLKQTMEKCQRDGSVGLPPTRIEPPLVGIPGLGGLCKGNTFITVLGLNDRGLVTVRVYVEGREPMELTVHGESQHTFDVAPLETGSVYATQEICDVVSDPSPQILIRDEPPITQQPNLVKPLYSCARSVRVTDVHPGAKVCLYIKSASDDSLNKIEQIFNAPTGDISVSPLLSYDDEIWVEAKGCGSRLESPHLRVELHPPIGAPKIRTPVENEDPSVQVSHVIPTATVYIYVRDKDKQWELEPLGIKERADGRGSEQVRLSRRVKTGQELAAAQYYCEVFSGKGEVVTVIKKPPIAPNLISPSAGQKEVVTTGNTFTWSDPGAATERKADSFDIAIYGSAGVIASALGQTSTSYSLPAGKLKFGTTSSWTVQGRNSSGLGQISQANFTTLAPKPVLTSYDQTTLQLKGSNFPPNINFVLRYKYQVKTDTSFGDAAIPAGSDGRQGKVAGTYTSNSTWTIDIKVDLYTGTPIFQLLVRDESTGSVKSVPLKGPVKGSEVTLIAEYPTPSIGLISSDPLVFSWTRDTMLA